MGDFFKIKNSRAVEKVLNNKHKEGGFIPGHVIWRLSPLP